MSLLTSSAPEINTVGDLLDRLGGVSPDRVRLRPAPGTATEQDVIDIEAREKRHYELVDGVLVEKATGYNESFVAGLIATLLNQYVLPRKLGFVTGSDGMMRLFPGLVRIPDVAFVSRDRFPGGRLTNEAIPSLAPDLVVEVLSEGNTIREMTRKRGEYFDAGARLLWIVDAKARTVAVYTNPQEPTVLDESQTLTGDPVLPGFSVAIKTLFEELP
jgi:Uma2 family endonuclease